MPDVESDGRTPIRGLDESRPRIQQALRRLSDYREIVDLADELMGRGKPVQAAATLSRALEIHAGDAETFTARGSAYAALGDFARAIEDLDRALDLHPSYAPALAMRGRLHLHRGDHAAALLDLGFAIDVRPTAASHLDRGLARQATGDGPGAQADYARAIEIDSGDPRAWAARGLLRLAEGTYARATDDLRTALESSSRASDRSLVRALLQAMARLVVERALESSEYEALAATYAHQDSPPKRRTISQAGRQAYHSPLRARASVVLASIMGLVLAVLAMLPLVGRPTDSGVALSHGDEVTDHPTDTRFASGMHMAIDAARSGQVPVAADDAVTFADLDYDYLVSQGIYTREEADLQRALDEAMVAQSVASTSKQDRGDGHER